MRTGTAPKRVKTTQNRGCFLCSTDGLRGICGDSLPCLCPDALFAEEPSCFRKMAGQISTRETKNKKALRGVPEGRISADGDPGESRTLDLLLRRQSLYPSGLRGRSQKRVHHNTSASKPQEMNAGFLTSRRSTARRDPLRSRFYSARAFRRSGSSRADDR